MEKRARRGVLFISKRHFPERVRGRAGKFALRVIAQDFLETGARIRGAMQVAITLAEREGGVRAARAAAEIIEVFLVFWNSEIVKLASEEAIGVIDLTAIGAFGVARSGLGRLFRRHTRCLEG